MTINKFICSSFIGIDTAKLAVELDENNFRAHQW